MRRLVSVGVERHGPQRPCQVRCGDADGGRAADGRWPHAKPVVHGAEQERQQKADHRQGKLLWRRASEPFEEDRLGQVAIMQHLPPTAASGLFVVTRASAFVDRATDNTSPASPK